MTSNLPAIRAYVRAALETREPERKPFRLDERILDARPARRSLNMAAHKLPPS